MVKFLGQIFRYTQLRSLWSIVSAIAFSIVSLHFWSQLGISQQTQDGIWSTSAAQWNFSDVNAPMVAGGGGPYCFRLFAYLNYHWILLFRGGVANRKTNEQPRPSPSFSSICELRSGRVLFLLSFWSRVFAALSVLRRFCFGLQFAILVVFILHWFSDVNLVPETLWGLD